MKKYTFENLVNLAKRSNSRIFVYDSSTKEASVILPASDFEELVGGNADELSYEDNGGDFSPTEFQENDKTIEHWKADNEKDDQEDDFDTDWESTGDILKHRTPSSQLNEEDETLNSFMHDAERQDKKPEDNRSSFLDSEYNEPVPFKEHGDEKNFGKGEPLQTDDPVFYEEPV